MAATQDQTKPTFANGRLSRMIALMRQLEKAERRLYRRWRMALDHDQLAAARIFKRRSDHIFARSQKFRRAIYAAIDL